MKALVMPNTVPFNDMVFDNHLQVGEFAVKTRSYNLKYRGPVLFYNSTRTEPNAMSAYYYVTDKNNHKVIIGIADLVETRPLSTAEAKKMVCNFNNITSRELSKILKDLELQDSPNGPFLVNSQMEYWFLITPGRIGFFFKNLRRFKIPVRFNWPAGAIRPITIQTARYPKLHAQILDAKLST